MAIRVNCEAEGYEKCWIDFRDVGWRFKDRQRILRSTSDLETLEIILTYIEDWKMLDVDGKNIPFKKFIKIKGKDEEDDPVEELNISLFDDLDDSIMIPFVISSWFEARSGGMTPKKVT